LTEQFGIPWIQHQTAHFDTMKNTPLKTAAQAREWFNHQGLSVSEWARQNGFGISLTRQILAGQKPCHRGQSHQIAVLLGMKAGEITRIPAEARQRGPRTNTQQGASQQ
jgi:gp16 family phage-associated protein